jgi:ATP-dependent 26S proteasome regulatory subunit
MPIALDPMYESEFDKLKEELNPNNKTEMIGQLQSQIENLRREVEL